MVIYKIIFTIILGIEILEKVFIDKQDENIFTFGIDIFLKSWMIAVLWVIF